MSVEVKELNFSYKKSVPVLRDLSFSLPSGKFICLLGPNGVGKSTLFKCMLGLLRGYSGEIRIDGEDIRTLTQKQLARRVAYIPQSTAPVFNYTVSDVVLMGTTSLTSGFSSPGRREAAYVENALETLNIGHLRDRLFMNISGGERQLVLIARALAQQANILFMDEPTKGVDVGAKNEIKELIIEKAEKGTSFVVVSSELEEIMSLCDRIIVIYEGRLVGEVKKADFSKENLMKGIVSQEEKNAE